MSKIYMSFLGLGKIENKVVIGYSPTRYELNGKETSKLYKFIQSAEMELLSGDYFDTAFIIVTPDSMNEHFATVELEMTELGVNDIRTIEIGNDLNPENQWTWFEKVLSSIGHGDELTIDMTHGFRIGPIVISAAIHFLQKSKNITLKHVLYGAYDQNRKMSPIIDMKEFYIINEWADAVSRLVDDADARKLSAVAEKAPEFQIGNLGKPELIGAFNDLTAAVRNVEIQRIGEKAHNALKIVEDQKKDSTKTAEILLELVTDKFAALAAGEPSSGKYDLDYFRLQLEVIKVLNEHKLFMQSYTVMREFIGSIGLIQYKKARTTNDKRFKADIFVNMIQFETWEFPEGDQKKASESLRPYYDQLNSIGVVTLLKEFCTKLIDFRNGFSHGWTRGKAKAPEDIEKSAVSFHKDLERVIDILTENNVFPS